MRQCALELKYLSNDISYQPKIIPVDENSKIKVYYCICETTFDLRYANHKKSFNHRNRKLATELFNEFRKLKDNKRTVITIWENAITTALRKTK